MPFKKINDEQVQHNRLVGSRIRIFRELINMSQVELGSKLGFSSRGTMSLIESGKRGISLMQLRKAAHVLDTYPELLSDQRDLTKNDLVILNTLIKIVKDTKHPLHKTIIELASK